MDRLISDVRFALRGFGRAPGFVATAVAIVALGIGMSVAMFTVFRTVLIRRLPVMDQDRIAVMWTYRNDPRNEFTLGTKELSVVRQESRTMREIAAIAHWPATASPFAYGERSIELNRGMVTGNFFAVLGAKPILGRLFTPDDDEVPGSNSVGAHRTLVLSYQAWRETFGGDSGVIGRHLIEPLVHTDYQIIGVAPPGLEYPAGVGYWIPMWQGWRSTVSAFAVARLAPGATIAAAANEYLAIERRLQPGAEFGGVHAATFTDTILGNVRPVLGVLTAAVAVLLLIACMNVGNLLLLRGSSREREIAVRRAIGASYADIVRQLLVEALAIVAAGGLLGWAIAAALVRLLVMAAPPNLPRLDDVQLAGAPIAVALLVSLLAVLLCGLAPALASARANLSLPLRLDSRAGSESRSRRRLRETLVACQIGLALIMLGGAGLLAKSLMRLQTQDVGFVSDHLSVFWYSWNAIRDDTETKVVRLGDRLVRRIQTVPGVTAATQIVIPPLLGEGIWQTRVQLDGQTDAEAATNPNIDMEFCGPDYFKVFGVPIVRGRAFTDSDRAGAPPVAIVSEAVARQLWQGQDPLGKRIRMLFEKEPRTVVGVARDTHLRTLRLASPTVYTPVLQGTWQGSIAIRSSSPLSMLIPSLRAAGKDVDPDLELWNPRTMDEVLADPLAQPRLGALLMTSFGTVSLLLAAIGLFGVMTSLVRYQTREFGIRIALGATPGRVRADVLRHAAIVVGIGAGVGLVAALVASRILGSLLFEVSPTDPFALGGACVVLLIVAAAAAYLPARRATSIDPARALRAD